MVALLLSQRRVGLVEQEYAGILHKRTGDLGTLPDRQRDVLEELPKTATGKIQRYKLRQGFEG
jgi:acyl-coenzyme A synthetase/AMP-(fatty) acid ligase